MILEKQIDLEKLYSEPNTEKVREELLKLSGVGPKVADCILLFSDLKRLEVFPIDVWVRRVMNDLYIKEAYADHACDVQPAYYLFQGVGFHKGSGSYSGLYP